MRRLKKKKDRRSDPFTGAIYRNIGYSKNDASGYLTSPIAFSFLDSSRRSFDRSAFLMM